MPQIKGIDVSHHQGNIDWKKVAADGVKFAFIKATEGTSFVDPKFYTNVNGANAVGIKTGAYHFARFGSVEEAKKEAQHFLGVIKNVNLSYPAVLDLEVDQKKVGKKKLTDAAIAFLEELENAGYFAMLYSGKSFLENNLEEERLKPYALWVARYSSTLGRSADIWQYTSSGRVNGINGNVDMNIAYRDFAAIIESMKKKKGVQSTVQKNVVKDDVAGHWAEQSIRKAMKAGIIKGHSDGRFGPNEPVTRAQLAVILDRLGLLK